MKTKLEEKFKRFHLCEMLNEDWSGAAVGDGWNADEEITKRFNFPFIFRSNICVTEEQISTQQKSCSTLSERNKIIDATIVQICRVQI